MTLYIIQFSVNQGSAQPPPIIQPDDPFPTDNSPLSDSSASESESGKYYKIYVHLCIFSGISIVHKITIEMS